MEQEIAWRALRCIYNDYRVITHIYTVYGLSDQSDKIPFSLLVNMGSKRSSSIPILKLNQPESAYQMFREPNRGQWMLLYISQARVLTEHPAAPCIEPQSEAYMSRGKSQIMIYFFTWLKLVLFILFKSFQMHIGMVATRHYIGHHLQPGLKQPILAKNICPHSTHPRIGTIVVVQFPAGVYYLLASIIGCVA